MSYGPATTYDSYPGFFPSHWDQHNYNQSHDPVFPLLTQAPSFLRAGVFWAAPLTGDEFLKLGRAYKDYGYNPDKFGSAIAQWLGNAVGVSAVDGIVYVQESNGDLYAVDAASGTPIWCHCTYAPPGTAKLPQIGPPTVNAAMGQDLVENINGEPVVFVADGDVAFTFDNALKYPSSNLRGANYSSIYAFNGLTGKEIWRFDTAGEAMPTPVYKNGYVYANTGDGHLYVINATTGQLAAKMSNPGLAFSSMSSVNWYTTADGRHLMIYGTQNPDNMVAVDVTDPTQPTVAWTYSLPGGIFTGMGDVPPAVDPTTGTVVTDSLVKTGTNANGSPILDMDMYALNATTGALEWSHLACGDYYSDPGTSCDVPTVSFRGSIPMVHDGVMYVGVLLDQTYRAYDIATGKLLWVTSLAIPNEKEPQQPRGGSVWYDGKIILAESRQIYTLDPTTGAIDNDFTTPGYFAIWGITTPTVVGNEMYLGAASGWVFAAPASYIMNTPGGQPLPLVPPTNLPLPQQQAAYQNPSALPTSNQSAAFPSAWLSYAGGASHNAYVPTGPSGVSWQVGLNGSIPLDQPPRDDSIFGTEIAGHMTALAYGTSWGVAPAQGMIFAGTGDHSVYALNAYTGAEVWRFDTINSNLAQPIVTPNTVVVPGGDQWMNFSSVVKYMQGKPLKIGASFQDLHGLNPQTGQEVWTFYTNGDNAMTPLYDNGNIYWLNGTGHLWAINADTGAPVAPFLNSSGLPALPPVAGSDAVDSANIYKPTDGSDHVMIAGTTDDMYGIDLATGAVLWSQGLTGLTPYTTGFAGASPAVDQNTATVVSTVVVNPDTSANTATLEAFALDAKTGAVLWTQSLGTGAIPTGFSASTVVLNNGTAYVLDPMTGTEYGLNMADGSIRWQTPVQIGAKKSWGPGTVVGNDLIQPVGGSLDTFNTQTGALVNQLPVGGAFTYNNATVIGQTVYIGNGYGWLTAMPLSQVLGTS